MSAGRWANTAERLAALEESRREQLTEHVRRFVQPSGTERALDAGTGTGALAFALARAEPPSDGSPRAIHRFRRSTEPWALEALAYLGADEHADAVRDAREHEPDKPLLRGDELGIEPGPEVGRLLELVAEERAAGTIATREEAVELVRRALG